MMMVKRRWRGGLVAWVEWWLKMSMQCCGEKRGLHIVVRKGGEKRGSHVESCEKRGLHVESCGCSPSDLGCCDRVPRNVKCCDRRYLWVGLQFGLQFGGSQFVGSYEFTP